MSLATLWSPDGSKKVVVTVGSPEASQLLNAGWVLGSGTSGTQISLADALASINTQNTNDQNTNNDDDLQNWINEQARNNNLTPEQKAVLDMINKNNDVVNYNIDDVNQLNELIQNAAKQAEVNINPYYERISQRTLEDMRQALADIRKASEEYAKREKVNYAKTLANVKQSLRARGLTFSGNSRALLGKEGALNSKGIEGSVPQARRLDYQSKINEWQRQARDIGQKTERLLGSNRLNSNFGQLYNPYANGINYSSGGRSNIYNPLGNVKYGDLDLQKKRDIERAKWRNVGYQSSYIY